MQLAAESIIEVGRELIEQKGKLGHGNFLPWIEAEFGMSERSAQNFMSVAEKFGSNTQRVADLSYRALIALSSDSTPPEVREQVLDRAANGEKVSAREAMQKSARSSQYPQPDCGYCRQPDRRRALLCGRAAEGAL